jgi:hypothetical protein
MEVVVIQLIAFSAALLLVIGLDTVIRGEVRCRQMRADADNRICRGLTDPNGALVTATAVEFQVFACPGLVLAAP